MYTTLTQILPPVFCYFFIPCLAQLEPASGVSGHVLQSGASSTRHHPPFPGHVPHRRTYSPYMSEVHEPNMSRYHKILERIKQVSGNGASHTKTTLGTPTNITRKRLRITHHRQSTTPASDTTTANDINLAGIGQHRVTAHMFDVALFRDKQTDNTTRTTTSPTNHTTTNHTTPATNHTTMVTTNHTTSITHHTTETSTNIPDIVQQLPPFIQDLWRDSRLTTPMRPSNFSQLPPANTQHHPLSDKAASGGRNERVTVPYDLTKYVSTRPHSDRLNVTNTLHKIFNGTQVYIPNGLGNSTNNTSQPNQSSRELIRSLLDWNPNNTSQVNQSSRELIRSLLDWNQPVDRRVNPSPVTYTDAMNQPIHPQQKTTPIGDEQVMKVVNLLILSHNITDVYQVGHSTPVFDVKNTQHLHNNPNQNNHFGTMSHNTHNIQVHESGASLPFPKLMTSQIIQNTQYTTPLSVVSLPNTATLGNVNSAIVHTLGDAIYTPTPRTDISLSTIIHDTHMLLNTHPTNSISVAPHTTLVIDTSPVSNTYRTNRVALALPIIPQPSMTAHIHPTTPPTTTTSIPLTIHKSVGILPLSKLLQFPQPLQDWYMSTHKQMDIPSG